MTDQNLDAFRTRCQARVESALDEILPPASVQPARLHEAMRYTVLASGKRIRPLLAYATGEALGVEPALLDRPASAVEMIHAYSLIHDDLPAMDDDDLRRGRPTCHRAFDEATAILAGDALQTLAFQALAEAPGLSARVACRDGGRARARQRRARHGRRTGHGPGGRGYPARPGDAGEHPYP